MNLYYDVICFTNERVAETDNISYDEDMNILMLFATNSGATGIVADLVSRILKSAGHTVLLKNPQDASFDDVSNTDLLLLASPSWDFADKEGQPHQDYLPFFAAMEGKTVEGKKCAVIGLGDSSYAVFCGSADHLENMVKKMQGELVLDTLKIDGFYYDQQKHEQSVSEWTSLLCQKLKAT